MSDRVLVRQAVSTVDAKAGTEVWLDDSAHVRGMVAGGYWEVVDRVASVAAPVAKVKKQVEVDGGDDQVGPSGGDG